MRSDATRAHYDRLAGTYEENWIYSPALIEWTTEGIVQRLRPTSTTVVLDVGCGTGLYSRGLAVHAKAVVCADPSEGMLSHLPADERLVPLRAGAEDIVAGRVPLPYDSYDAILLKEVVHHLPDLPATLAGLTRLLRPGGRFLVSMLPQDLGYPLFDAALRLFRRLQPDPGTVAGALTDAGLDVEISYDGFPVTFTRERYIEMVRGRYMSILSTFSDAELERGIDEIRGRYPGPDIRFAEPVAFVLGVRR
ncbi:class I SAM-dependent methyltransferase [Spongiactinospora sp. TRM90649]|uniref:class I SAM-dependent methyltransferase n=1 Tax=Spongiactinospora sp. TRM90649 TaxID=3031114 RepID=UPI0023F977D9|nr:class I SAM-dependent methyltransferase [Spongiactinospora sp. TRM90649]MDF5755572.1 class I SAM-dependent methyltransferase [Spongiactinospora sp. TRM90649]